MTKNNKDNTSSTEVPVEVQVNSENGVDPQALTLATAFMEKVGGLARLTKRRGDLSHLYISTMGSWASPEVLADVSLQRHFKQILFALAHSLNVVKVVEAGRFLRWNRYRDNAGNEIEDTGQGDRRQGDRRQGDRRQDDRRQDDRRQGDRHQGDRQQGDRQQGDRQQGDRRYRYQDGGDGDRSSRRSSQ